MEVVGGFNGKDSRIVFYIATVTGRIQQRHVFVGKLCECACIRLNISKFTMRRDTASDSNQSTTPATSSSGNSSPSLYSNTLRRPDTIFAPESNCCFSRRTVVRSE